MNSNEKAIHEPQDLKELEALLKEFVERFTYVENEIDGLKEDQKNLISDYEEKLDIKTLKQAIRIVRAKRKVEHLDTFELQWSHQLSLVNGAPVNLAEFRRDTTHSARGWRSSLVEPPFPLGREPLISL